jgi:hypothetical protein
MKKINDFQSALLMMLIFAATTCMGNAQVIEEWVAIYNGSGNGDDEACDLALDRHGNVYVTGHSAITPGYPPDDIDYITIKYNPDGEELWIASYDYQGNQDEANAIVVDSLCNVYVTGKSLGQTGNITTIKYDSLGTEQWIAMFPTQNLIHYGMHIEIDDQGYVYVATAVSNDDYIVIKYDCDGIEQWTSRYNGPGSDWDEVNGLVVDGHGNVYVTGMSHGGESGYDCATVKFNSTGQLIWVERYNSPWGGYTEEGVALALDPSGNIIVTGDQQCWYSGSFTKKIFTIKYDPNGNQIWIAEFLYDYQWPIDAEDSVVDPLGNVYVTGTDGWWFTIKYDSNGEEQWVNIHDQASYPRAMALDTCSNVYITGYAYGGDFHTLKYSSQGSFKWSAVCEQYEGGKPCSVALDSLGNVFIAGYRYNNLSSCDYITIKYQQESVPIIAVSENSLFFGNVTIGSHTTLQLSIYNVGDTTLVIYDVTLGNLCFGHNYDPADSLIQPGDSLEITVTFTPADTITYTDTLGIDNNDEFCGIMVTGLGEQLLIIEEDELPALPAAFALSGPYPNPFNPVTTFNIELPAASRVSLAV